MYRRGVIPSAARDLGRDCHQPRLQSWRRPRIQNDKVTWMSKSKTHPVAGAFSLLMAEPPASIRWHTFLEKPAKLQRSLWDSQKAVSYAGSVDHVAADPVGRVVAHSDRTLTAA